MMNIDDVKILYGLACFSLCLVIVSPTIAARAVPTLPNGAENLTNIIVKLSKSSTMN